MRKRQSHKEATRMRSSKLVPALAAATLLALAPAGAMAKPAGHAKAGAAPGGCRPTLEISSPVITFGESVTVFGELCPNATNSASSIVTVYSRVVTRAHAQRGATVVSTATVQGNHYSFTASPQFNTTFYVRTGNTRSAPKTVKVAPQVSIKEAPAEGTPLLTGATGKGRARTLNKYKFSGTVTPFEPGEIVALQRENATANEEWLRIGLAAVNNEGKFTIEHVFRAPGDANLRFVAHPKLPGVQAPGASSVMSYVINQPQNPQLEIHSSANPITAGTPVTISGKVAGSVSSVALFAHTAGAKFAQLATAPVTGGEYTFTQAPTQNTAYQVRDSVTRSAVIVEGVKPAVTATPSATSVQAGVPVTFTGTVTPAPTHPHLIYLERQNASGLSFHVVEVAQIGPGGTYTLSHAFFGPGTAKLRVKVPGDPERQGVGSAIVPITITPAPPGSLKAPLPSKQPSFGQ
jgi:hypothetical protein